MVPVLTSPMLCVRLAPRQFGYAVAQTFHFIAQLFESLYNVSCSVARWHGRLRDHVRLPPPVTGIRYIRTVLGYPARAATIGPHAGLPMLERVAQTLRIPQTGIELVNQRPHFQIYPPFRHLH